MTDILNFLFALMSELLPALIIEPDVDFVLPMREVYSSTISPLFVFRVDTSVSLLSTFFFCMPSENMPNAAARVNVTRPDSLDCWFSV